MSYANNCKLLKPQGFQLFLVPFGTVEDWQSISDRVQVIAEYDLDWWTARLMPICREFVETALGRSSLEFWRCIYKSEPVYGVELITGWLTDLFPYITHQ